MPAAGLSSRMADLGAQQTTLELGQRKRSVISALPKRIKRLFTLRMNKNRTVKIICLLKQENERMGAMQVPGQ